MTLSMHSNSTSELTARRLVARYFRIWNSGDPKLIGELITSDWVDHAHPKRRSAEDVATAIIKAHKENPGMRVYVDALLGDENLVTVNGRTQTADGIESWLWMVRFEHGRMSEMWTYAAD
jgi:hypothetical protein